MKTPTVSVVMGTYNRERFVRASLESVLKQSFHDYEVIVVDDASTDDTQKILREYADRVRLVFRESNSGRPAVPRNEAMALAKGKYIAFLDSDDLWYQEKLTGQVHFMETNPAIGLSHTFCHVIDDKSNELRIRREEDMPRGGDLFSRLIGDSFITTSTVMLRYEICQAVGGFSEESALRCGEDREFFLRVARDHSIGFVDEVLGAYRRSAQNILGDDWALQCHVLHTQQWILEHPDLWRGKVSRERVKAAYVAKCVEYSYYWQARHDIAKARELIRMGLKVVPGNRLLWVRNIKLSARRFLMAGGIGG